MTSPRTRIDRTGLGLAALGRPAYINLGRDGALPAERSVSALRAATHEVLDDAYSAGVRKVDVARSYGLAEDFLASWLRDRGHRDVVVSSKWGYAYVGEWQLDAEVHEAKEHSLGRFRAQWTESAGLLGAAISLYQVHSLTPESPLFTDEPLLDALAGLAASGVRVGFSTSGPAQAEVVRRASALEVAGQRVFTAVQSTWNVLEPSVGEALAEAHEAGFTVLLKETLANGRLVVDPPEPVRAMAAAYGVGPDAIAVAAALARPWADTVLIGPSSRAQLASNLDGAKPTLSGAELAELAEAAENAEAYWARRSSLQWR